MLASQKPHKGYFSCKVKIRILENKAWRAHPAQKNDTALGNLQWHHLSPWSVRVPVAPRVFCSWRNPLTSFWVQALNVDDVSWGLKLGYVSSPRLGEPRPKPTSVLRELFSMTPCLPPRCSGPWPPSPRNGHACWAVMHGRPLLPHPSAAALHRDRGSADTDVRTETRSRHLWLNRPITPLAWL